MPKLPTKHSNTNKLQTSSKSQTNNGEMVCKIAQDIKHLAVPIDSLKLDPVNARAHPTRNLEAIKESLTLYSQVKPIVVRKSTKVIVAGNGTWEAAKALGWTHIAAILEDMTAVEAAGYGLADNRTAELAKWKYEAVAEIEKLLRESNHPVIGWNQDELFSIRTSDFTPPTIGKEESDTDSKDKKFTIIISEESLSILSLAVNTLREREEDSELSDADCLECICREWLEIRTGVSDGD